MDLSQKQKRICRYNVIGSDEDGDLTGWIDRQHPGILIPKKKYVEKIMVMIKKKLMQVILPEEKLKTQIYFGDEGIKHVSP